MEKSAKIYVAGHRGLVGSAIVRRLQKDGYDNLLLKTSAELDLTNQQATAAFFAAEKPDYVFLAAAKVGGIQANNIYPAEFIHQNLAIQTNVIHHSYLNNVKKLLFLGSSCIYPRECPQPMREEHLLTGPLEPTNEPYAIAKIAGIEMCWSYNRQYGTSFIPVMPTNLYGPNDNYDLETSHAFPALLRKIHLGLCLENEDWDTIRKDMNKNPVEGIDGTAPKEEILNILGKYGIHNGKPVTVGLWGTGSPKREFLHVDDLADACLFIINNMDFKDLSCQVTGHNFSTQQQQRKTEIKNTHINIGTGEDLSIEELAKMIGELLGYKGIVIWDATKPDGTKRKLLDTSRLTSLGWQYKIDLAKGILQTYKSYLKTL